MTTVVTGPRPLVGRGPALGMGCSRLGSLLASSGQAEAEQAVRAALAAGITMFDTANIYGQGSSELILGRLLPCGGVADGGVEICTKAGFVTPAPLWALRLAKTVMRRVMPRRGGMHGQLAQRRARSFDQRFDPAHLSRSLGGSLRRLRRQRVDVFLLHNPSPAEASRGELWTWVEAEIARGRIGAFGVSCAGEAADRVWLDHPQLTVAQIPARNLAPAPAAFVADPRAARLRILARELIGPGHHGPEAIADCLRTIAAAPHVSVALLGMSSSRHVQQAAALFRAVAPLVAAA